MKIYTYLINLIPALVFAQFGNPDILPASFGIDTNYSNVKTKKIEKPVLKNINDKPYLKVAEGFNVEYSFSDFFLDHIETNGNKIYHLAIETTSLEGMMLEFNKIVFIEGCKLWVINPQTHEYVGVYTKKDIDSNFQLITSALEGNKIIIEYLEPSNYTTPNFEIKKIYYFLPETLGPPKNNVLECMQEIACNNNQVYTNIKDAICKVVMVTNNSIGNCSGTLINNTRGDGKLYVLTANHCAETNENSTFAKWEFHFYYEKPNCNSKSANRPIILKGSELVSRSSPLYSTYESDFLLIKITSPIPDNINPLLLGWSRDENLSDSGASIHHPYGDSKKISYYHTPLGRSFKCPTNQEYTHFKVTWSNPGSDKISVTYGGSSGSCLLNDKGQLIGTLTGGFSSCQNTSGNDYYGRMSYHWNKNNGNDSFKLEKWLDPDGTGKESINPVFYKNTSAYTGAPANISIMNSLNNIEYSIANKILNIKWNMPMFTVNLYNLLGQLVLSTHARNHSIEVDLHHINSGLYIIETVSNDKRNIKKFYF